MISVALRFRVYVDKGAVRGEPPVFFCLDRHDRLKFSQPYATQAEAEAVRDWLIERANGYPPRPALAAWPRLVDSAWKCSACEGATWEHRRICNSHFLP